MNMDMRFRKAFRYPDESGSDREELDEEEQERVIQQLQSQNEARNAQYSMIFTGITLLLTTMFMPSILSASTLGEALLSFLSILSLGKKPLLAENDRSTCLRSALVPVNGAVCLVLTACFFIGAGSSYTIRPVLYLIPGAMLAVILLARETMLSVDLSALKDLQYEYKGA
ncbi:uncharacterized protein N7477_008066 [Penicillium maclennaniae]|uniref:uncharacterized protein n=1 Tax=Penicillium maclennaniae TaxID=1343394 RepID=UPI002541CB35|nr:uncharacterized protein N7477_008066 [Penicillium maclennaniae]KAJ5665618.1 hypothetical protein N7477_008066 [Penicillium maclennaniae]